MQKSSSAKSHTSILKIFLSVLTVIVIIDACRKIDYRRDKKPEIDNLNRFFTIPANTNPSVIAIVELIKKQEEKYHFVNALSKRIGFPVWNKALIASKKNRSNGDPNATSSQNTNDNSQMIRTYIPFTNDTVVDASLIVTISQNDTTFNLLNDYDYRRFSFDSTSALDQWNAKDVFHIFSIFEKSVLNHKSLLILDRRLFPAGDPNRDVVVKIKNTSSDSSSHGGSFIDPEEGICDIWDVCYAPDDGFEELCNNECTEDCYYWTHSELDCINIFWNLGLGGGNEPDYSLWWNDPDLGLQNAISPGWEPTDLVFNHLSDYSNKGFQHFDNWTVSLDDSRDIEYWKDNNIDTVGLDTCIRKILDKLLNGNNIIGRLLGKMERSIFIEANVEKFKVVLRVDTISAHVAAHTLNGNYNQNTGVFTDTIIVKDSIAHGASEVGMAASLIHEFVHAYLKSIFFRYWYSSLSPTDITSLPYDTLFNFYVDSLAAINTRHGLTAWRSLDPERDHNIMSQKFLGIFEEILKTIDNNRNPGEFYWDLNWGGLMYTRTWLHYFPSYPNGSPSNAAPNNDSTYGLKYALTAARIDSIRHYDIYEHIDTAHAKGRHKVPGGCY